MVVVIWGLQGMIVCNVDDGIIYLFIVVQEVFDVFGVGDMVVVVLLLGLGFGFVVEDVVELVNCVVGVVVVKVGIVIVFVVELYIVMYGMGFDGCFMVLLDGVVVVICVWQVQGQLVVFINGCFDLLYLGYVSLFGFVWEQGDKLIVVINLDVLVKCFKGFLCFVQDEDSCVLVMEVLCFVDLVVIFNEDMLLEVIIVIQLDVLVKGVDYKFGDVVGGDVVIGCGGCIVFVLLVDGQSMIVVIVCVNGFENV